MLNTNTAIFIHLQCFYQLTVFLFFELFNFLISRRAKDRSCVQDKDDGRRLGVDHSDSDSHRLCGDRSDSLR